MSRLVAQPLCYWLCSLYVVGCTAYESVGCAVYESVGCAAYESVVCIPIKLVGELESNANLSSQLVGGTCAAKKLRRASPQDL